MDAAGLDALLDFSVGLTLEGEELTLEERRRILSETSGLVLLRGKWVEIDREKISALLSFWEKRKGEDGAEGISFSEGMRLLSGAGMEGKDALPAVDAGREWLNADAGDWLRSVLAGMRSPEGIAPADPGEDLKTQLRPYQQTGVAWLRFMHDLGLGACRADDMGLGKTIQVLALLLILRQRKASGASPPSGPALLVVPASLVANWKAEIGRFAPSLATFYCHPSETPTASLAAMADAKRRDATLSGTDLVITTYAMANRMAWGKAWCQNLEQYGDYENRIPRGRAYVRNGSVIDLKIGTARVDALVSGSHLYSVAIEIRPLKTQVWKGAKKACTGRIGSLLELLQGKLSREVMEIVTRPQTGLFPEPAEISFRCSCPDWASMCKHVAAVLYGVGARLDREPELLFRLRDVDHRELIAAPGAADLAASPGMGVKMIAEEDLAGIFGIEIDEGPAGRRATPTAPKRDKSEEIRTVSTEAAAPKRARAPKPAEGATPPESLKRKRGRTRFTPEGEVPPKPRRGRPPLVRKEISMPQQERKPSAASEKPAPPTEAPEPARPRRGRRPKADHPAATPEPPKRKRGRPRLTPKTGTADQATPLPEEPKRERPKLRPAFLRALREKTVASFPTRRRGRPPEKREA
jgi:uncharacterized Zn finger protein